MKKLKLVIVPFSKQLINSVKLIRCTVKTFVNIMNDGLNPCKEQSALLPHKRGPKVGKYKLLSKEEERIIIKIHRRLGASEFEIFHLLKNNFNVHPSVSTIYRTFKRYPLNKVRKAKIKRYVKQYPGELLHADTYYLAKSIMQERKRYYLFGILDDCTRLAYVEVINSITAAEVTRAFFHSLQFFLAHGIHTDRVMTDNGIEFTAFTSQKAKKTHFFETMLNIVGVDHTYTRPYHPQSNGKIERFWKILFQECIVHLNFGLTLDTLSSELNGFLYRYNYQRRHGSFKLFNSFRPPNYRYRNVEVVHGRQASSD